MTVDTDGEEKERRRKYMAILPTGSGEATRTENMKDSYVSIWSWGTEEEGGTTLPYQKGVDENWDPFDPTSLSAKFAAVFMQVKILLNYHVEQTVRHNGINQDRSDK